MKLFFMKINFHLKPGLLNQAHAGCMARGWFLEITFMRTCMHMHVCLCARVSVLCVCACACCVCAVCVHACVCVCVCVCVSVCVHPQGHK